MSTMIATPHLVAYIDGGSFDHEYLAKTPCNSCGSRILRVNPRFLREGLECGCTVYNDPELIETAIILRSKAIARKAAKDEGIFCFGFGPLYYAEGENGISIEVEQ
jgi:hypothetical protein